MGQAADNPPVQHREPISIATYAVIVAAVLVMILSGFSWRVASGNAAQAESYAPSGSLLQMDDPD